MDKWIKGKNILLMLLSLVISLVMWLYIVGVENPEDDIEIRDVSVAVTGQDIVTERGLIITEGINASVSLRIKGRRSALIGLDRENDVKVTLNLSDIMTTGQFMHVYDVTVPAGITVIDQAPYYINVTADKLVDKPVEVRFRLDANVAEGYTREPAEMYPPQLTLSGPQSVIDSISHALVTIHRDEAVSASIKDFRTSYVLVSTDGNIVENLLVSSDASEVVVSMPVSMYKDVKLGVSIVDGGGLTSDDVVIGLSHESIRISGDPALLESLNEITVGAIELSQVLGSSTILFNVPLPNDVKNLSGVTGINVTLTIKPGISRRVIATDRIEIIHKPESFNVEAITEAVSVTVRGPDAMVNDIYPHNIRVVVDLRDVELSPGQQSFPANAYLDGYTDVGIVGTDYSVVLNITPEE